MKQCIFFILLNIAFGKALDYAEFNCIYVLVAAELLNLCFRFTFFYQVKLKTLVSLEH